MYKSHVDISRASPIKKVNQTMKIFQKTTYSLMEPTFFLQNTNEGLANLRLVRVSAVEVCFEAAGTIVSSVKKQQVTAQEKTSKSFKFLTKITLDVTITTDSNKTSKQTALFKLQRQKPPALNSMKKIYLRLFA